MVLAYVKQLFNFMRVKNKDKTPISIYSMLPVYEKSNVAGTLNI